MRQSSNWLFSLLVISCLFLVNCNGGRFKPSGRKVPKILDDVTSGNYKKSLPIREAIAYDYCDCLSNIDWKLVMGRIERIENGDLEGKDISDKQKYREEGNFNNILSCSMLQVTNKYEGHIVTESSLDSLLIVIEETCPSIYKDFKEFEKRNWKEEE